MTSMRSEIYWLAGPWVGRLGIAARPRGADWLAEEVQGWSEADVATIVSLLEPNEVAELELGAEEKECLVRGIRFRSFPIRDRETPPSSAPMRSLVSDLNEELAFGRNVLIHCRQGIGRSALLAAALLAAAGGDPERELSRIAAARGRQVPDTEEQRRWIKQFAEGGDGYWGRLFKALQPHGRFVREFMASNPVERGHVQPGDLIFEPARGLYAGVPHIVELKWVNPPVLSFDVGRAAIEALVHFRDANPMSRVRLALATNYDADPSILSFARENDIELWEQLKRPEEIAARLLEWARIGGKGAAA